MRWDTGGGGGGGGDDARADAAADDDSSDEANGMKTAAHSGGGGEEAAIARWGNELLGASADHELDDEEEEEGEVEAGCSVLVVQARFWVVLGGSGWFWVGSGFWRLAPGAWPASDADETDVRWVADCPFKSNNSSKSLPRVPRGEAPRRRAQLDPA